MRAPASVRGGESAARGRASSPRRRVASAGAVGVGRFFLEKTTLPATPFSASMAAHAPGPLRARPAWEKEKGMMEATNYLNTRQAAAYLGLSTRTLDRYRVSGDGPVFHRFSGGCAICASTSTPGRRRAAAHPRPMTARGTAPQRRRRERHGEAQDDGARGGNRQRRSCNRGSGRGCGRGRPGGGACRRGSCHGDRRRHLRRASTWMTG